jgi:hypothetical protein
MYESEDVGKDQHTHGDEGGYRQVGGRGRRNRQEHCMYVFPDLDEAQSPILPVKPPNPRR